MSFTQPTPATWTIRFKRNKVTVVLHVDPMKPIWNVKEDLLNALRQSEKDDKLEGTPIPEDSNGIFLGKPISTHDFSKGWVDVDEEVDNSTGKPTGKHIGTMPDGLRGKGIKDNAILAFRFGSPKVKPEDGSDITSNERWNVVMPSYNDANDEDEADAGKP